MKPTDSNPWALGMQKQTSDNLEGNPTEDQLANCTHHPHRHCLHCEYDLHGLTKEPTCPECGEPFDPETPVFNKAYRQSANRQIWGTLFAGPLLILFIKVLSFLNLNFLVILAIAAALILPITSIRAAILFTQVEFVGNHYPSAFKQRPAKAIRFCLFFSILFLLPQLLFAGVLLLPMLYAALLSGS